MASNKTLFLIQTPYFDKYGPTRKAAGTQFPLGLGYIASHIKAHGYAVRFFDPNVQDIIPEEIALIVEEDRPLLVGISFMTPWFDTAKELCNLLKNYSPSTPIVLGGIHPSVMPLQTLRDISDADFVIAGEGEETLLELMNALSEHEKNLWGIAGLVWRDADGIIINDARPPIHDLNMLPYPDFTMIDQSLYRLPSFFSHFERYAMIHTSRGCPGRCVFCCSGHRLRTRVRERSIPNVIKEIDFLRERYDIEYLLIRDDTFTIKESRTKEFCDAIKSRHPDLKWNCMGRVNMVNYKVLAHMKEAGLHDIYYGIESGNEEVLRLSRKGITTDQSRLAVEDAARLGILTVGAFILGLPGETPETAEETIRFACSLPLTMALFALLMPYPGTKTFEDYCEFDPDLPIDFSKFIHTTGIDVVKEYTGLKGLAVEELPGLVAQAQRRFYFRPGQIIRMIRHANLATLKGYTRGFLGLLTKEINRRTVFRERPWMDQNI